MELGLVGLGRMGANMTRRLSRDGHCVVGYDRSAEVARDLAAEGENVVPVESLEALTGELAPPRAAWSMVPAGAPTDEVIGLLAEVLDREDIVIDGANSNYKDSLRRADMLSQRGIHFLDVGVSGGIWGLDDGYGMMIGGEQAIVDHLSPIFKTLAPAPDRGWGRVGPNGAGHFVKMVHNGIEYGIMQAYAEGFEIMKAKEEFDLDVHHIAETWRFGTVIRSWLLDLTARALADDPSLSDIKGYVEDSGKGRWTVFESIDLDVPAPVITLALQMRLRSRQSESFSAKLLAALRNEFGGHEVKPSY